MKFQIIFYLIFSIIILLSGLIIITTNNPINAILFLILTFFLTSCTWILLKAEFLATILILLYVGSVMVLFLFVIMMFDLNSNENKIIPYKNIFYIILIGTAILIKITLILLKYNFFLSKKTLNKKIYNNIDNIKKIGINIFSKNIYIFEISSILIFISIIIVVTIIMNNKFKKKHKNICN